MARDELTQKPPGLSRREVLTAGLSLGVVGLPIRWRPRLPSRDSIPPAVPTFAYFSDTHVSLKRNVAECRALMEEIEGVVRPSLAINGGDVVDYGWKGEYDSYDSVLSGLSFRTHHIPGNHDVRWAGLGLKIFSERVGAPYRSFDWEGCHFALLDSTVPLSHWGHFESEMLRWLEDDLARVGRQTPVFLATHHWVGRDQVMADNESALQKVIEPYNVKIVLTGHGHNDLLWRWDGFLCTMNKGLYQGSYQKVEVDRESGEVRLYRRTLEKPQLRLLAAVNLASDREKRKVWHVSPSEYEAGAPLTAPPDASEFRWNAGNWKPIESRSLGTEGLSPGVHLLSLRAGQEGQAESFPIRVNSKGAFFRSGWERKLSGGVMSHPLIAEGSLFVSAMDGAVYRLRASDGALEWRAKTGGYCHSSPRICGGTLVVGSADGFVYGLDPKDGAVLWKHPTQGPMYGSAAFARGVAAIGGGDGRIYGIEPKTGKETWRFDLPSGDTAFVQSPAAADGERFYFGSWDKHLYALDALTGKQLWRRLCTQSTFAFSPAIGGPAVAQNRVLVPANGNELYCFDAASGEPLWKAASPGDKFGYSGPRIEGGRVFIGCLGDKGEVRCVSLEEGKELWAAATGQVIYDSTPAVSEGIVSVGSVSGALWGIDAASGAIVGSFQFPTGHFLSSPAMDGRAVYAATYSDWVMRLDFS